MSDITSDVASVIDNLVVEMFDFGSTVIHQYAQEILLLMLLSVMFGLVWRVARRFLGTR